MMPTHSAFTYNTTQMIEWLKKQGYKDKTPTKCVHFYVIAFSNGEYWETTTNPEYSNIKDLIDCTENSELFKTITSMTNETEPNKELNDIRNAG